MGSRLLTLPLHVYEHTGVRLVAPRRVEHAPAFRTVSGDPRHATSDQRYDEGSITLAACRPEFSVVARACSLRSVAGEA